jgi:hypothetical protein
MGRAQTYNNNFAPNGQPLPGYGFGGSYTAGGGGSGSGGGGSSSSLVSTLSSSNGSANGSSNIPTAPNQRAQAQRAVNWQFSLILAATGVPQTVPGMVVPRGASVRVRANNGAAGGNAQQIFVAQYRAALLNGGGTPLASLDDIAFPVDNCAGIWVCGTAGDGVVISIITSSMSNS